MLIVDDEPKYSDQMRDVLVRHGWTVEVASTGLDGLQLLNNFRFDLVLLDWNLPQMTGLEICRKYRAGGGQSPIIFVTGRDGIGDMESGFDAGGDDYVTKPFDVRELLARVKALNRRPGRQVESKLSAHGVNFDPKLRTVSRTAQSVQLSMLEGSILEYLLRNKNRFFSASELFEAVWEPTADGSDETVRVRMRIMRQKLAKIGAENLIETVRGSGYVIRDENAV
ncbi:MAG TPA: response regulator transcription factor [Candidatus Obscuribacterales bacterium]